MTLQEALDAITNLERSERIKRGLPPDHVLSWDEFPFAFAKKQLRQLSAQIENTEFAAIDAYLKALNGDLRGADEAMRRFQASAAENPFAQIRFVEPLDAAKDLPPVVGTWPTEPSLFICCDLRYFEKFAARLLKSLDRHAPAIKIHVHIMSDLAPQRSQDRVTFTHDLGSVRSPHYFHAARFAHFAEALESAPALLMMDADSLATSDPAALLNSSDAGLRVRPGRIEPWNQFSGCLVRGTTKSLPYFRDVSKTIRSLIHRPFWGLDQYALFASYLRTRPTIELFGPDVAGVTADEPGLFWFTAGKQKETLATAETEFAKAYRSYR